MHALAAIEAATSVSSEEAAVDAVRSSLASVDDSDLMRRVATCLAVTSVWQMPPRRKDLARVRRWVERMRLEVTWVGSDG